MHARGLLLLSLLLSPFTPPQSGSGPVTLSALVESLPARDTLTPEEIRGLQDLVQTADIPVLQHLVSLLVIDTESLRPPLRRNALLLLLTISLRMTGKPPVLSGEPLLVPYLSRLAKLIHSDDPAVEGLDLLTLQNILQDANAKPALIRLLLPELQRPDANTTPPVPDPQTLGYPPATHMKSLTVPGPVVVGILLSAAATYVRDPKTDIIEAEEDPEVVAAVVRYLHRADQTPATLAETIRSIALTGGGSDPALSNELVPLLDSASPLVRSALLQWLPSIQLSPAAYAVARGKLEAMALDGSTPAGLRAMTRELLGCWSNNRHVMCVVQPL